MSTPSSSPNPLRRVAVLLTIAFVVAGAVALQLNHRWSRVEARIDQLESLLTKSTFQIARLRQQSHRATAEVERLRQELKQAQSEIARLAPQSASNLGAK